MAPIACREPECDTLTGEGIISVVSYWPTSQRTYWHNAPICLGENPAETYKHFDLCYSFKVLCRAEYGSTWQLHLAAKNYMRNYTAGQNQNQQITYERALQNLMVLMFSHYINHLESTRALEGHQMLMPHERLMVAVTLGHFHHWQRRVELEDWDKPNWVKVPTVSAGDFRHKYSPTLVLLGNTQHLTYTHPKLLGQCYDNVNHQGWLIGDLPARGKPPTKEQTQKIYNQEYKEVVAQIENTLDLSDESLSYPMVPTSLCNPEIILLLRLFREQWGLPEPPPSHMSEPWEFNIDGVQGLLDLSWSQWAPQVQLNDIDKDPRYSQYLYQEANEYKEDKEDMEVDEWAPGKAGGTCMAAPTGTWHPYHHPEATYSYSMADQTLGSPRSIHTDTDIAMEMGGLGMSSGRSETHRVMPRMEAPQKQTRMLSALDLVSSITKGMTAAATEILERFACPPLVDDVADAAIWECFQQQRAAASQSTPPGTEASSWISAFDWLGHWAQTPQKEDQWVPRLEMTPRKVERGHQSSRMTGQEPPCSTSQKRHSQSQPRDEVDSKKDRTEGDGRSSKVQVGIDWSNTGIQKPVPKLDPRHLSFKPDPSGASSNQQPWVKSLYPRDPKNRVALVVLHPDPKNHPRDRAERPAVRPLGLLIQRSWNSKRSLITGLWPGSTIWTRKDMWKRFTPSNISIGTQRASHLKLSRLLTGAANVLMSDFIIPYPHFPITYSMNLPGLDRVVDKSLPNPTT